MSKAKSAPKATQKSPSELAVIILAAGKGTRMKSALPKVMHPVAGLPMLHHILQASHALKPNQTVVVTGFGAEVVEEYCTQHFPTTQFARQTEQKGTGHAVQMAEKTLKGFTGTVVIVYGDIMLAAAPHTLPKLLHEHGTSEGLTLLTAELENPTGFGRIFKKGGKLVSVEEKDCSEAERKIKTANPCIFALPASLLWKLLKELTPDNAQHELYLTDIIESAAKHKLPVNAHAIKATRALVGINSREELSAMESEVQTALRKQHMANGVTLLDPSSVYFGLDTVIANDVTIGQNVVFGPGVKIDSGVTILPFCHMEGAHVHAGARIGPFARLRPGTNIGANAHIGNFVELKNTTFGKGSKANHLSYLGDTSVGEGVNLGAGTITANYNSKTKVKSKTTIADGASTGAHTVLVAPVSMGKNSSTGAHTVVRQNIDAETLVVTLATTKTKTAATKRRK